VTEEAQSLITDEHLATIGRRSAGHHATVHEKDARRMRDILSDTDPRWADGTGMAPPYIVAGLAGRRPDMPRILPGGLLTTQEWKFTRPFRIGEELTGYNEIVDIRERLGGRYGHSVLVTTATNWYDAEEKLVASILATYTQFDPKGAKRDEE
jgi:hypothetical protein